MVPMDEEEQIINTEKDSIKNYFGVELLKNLINFKA